MTNKSKAEEISIAQESRKLLSGVASPQMHMQLPKDMEDRALSQTAKERGFTYQLGAVFEENRCILLEQLLAAIGAPVTSTFVSPDKVEVVVGGRRFAGENHGQLLQDILILKLELLND